MEGSRCRGLLRWSCREPEKTELDERAVTDDYVD